MSKEGIRTIDPDARLIAALGQRGYHRVIQQLIGAQQAIETIYRHVPELGPRLRVSQASMSALQDLVATIRLGVDDASDGLSPQSAPCADGTPTLRLIRGGRP